MVSHPRTMERLASSSSVSSSKSSLVVTGEAGADDVLREEAAVRLRVVAMVYGGIWALMGVMDSIFWATGFRFPGLDEASHTRMLILTGVAIAFSVWTARAATKCANATARDLTRMGLFFGVVATLMINVAQYVHVGADTIAGATPWAAMWIVFFPILVPATFRQAAVAATLAALTTPLTVAVSELVHARDLSLHIWIMATMSSLIAAGLAKVPHKVMSRLHEHFNEAEQAARRLGSYQLLKKLGAGGMGEVWQAQHRMLRRPAAVKLIKADLFGAGGSKPEEVETAVRRFEREAQVTAELQSPHTVRLFDFGRSAGGQFYYVMELLEGLDLETLITKYGPLDAERVVHLLTQACHSLEEAHRRGLIHRDIKPANIYACRFALDHDFVKVLDFGLVKRERNVKTSVEMGLTMDGAISGTPAYMAPEMCLGDQAVDGRSDLYALGCVGYWLLTGQLVFDVESAVRMLMAHVGEAPAPPSERTELPIPPELDALILDCLAKDPNDRPQTAAELGRRLQAIPMAQTWNEDRAERWWSRHRPTTVDAPSQAPPASRPGTAATEPAATTPSRDGGAFVSPALAGVGNG